MERAFCYSNTKNIKLIKFLNIKNLISYLFKYKIYDIIKIIINKNKNNTLK